MAPKLETRPLSWARSEKTGRTHVDPAQDIALTESIKKYGILQPPGALTNGVLVYGHRRVRCGIAAGLTETLFHILPHAMEESEVPVLTLTENIQRQQLTDPEVYLSVKEILRFHPAWQRKDLAGKLSLSPPMVTNILSVDGLIPAAREAFLAGAFGFSTAYEISQGDEAQQHQMLSLKLGGASRGELRQTRRKANNHETIKMHKVRVALPGGGSVALTGKELGMAEVVEILAEVLKEAKKAADTFDVRTWIKMMADKSKGG